MDFTWLLLEMKMQEQKKGEREENKVNNSGYRVTRNLHNCSRAQWSQGTRGGWDEWMRWKCFQSQNSKIAPLHHMWKIVNFVFSTIQAVYLFLSDLLLNLPYLLFQTSFFAALFTSRSRFNSYFRDLLENDHFAPVRLLIGAKFLTFSSHYIL